MVQRFAYLFAFALILQMIVGVASAYCMHETGKASEHFGHHQHVHQGADEGEEESKKFAPDPDCASCTNASLFMLSWPSELAQGNLSSYYQVAQVRDWPVPYIGLPERPNWIRAA